MSIKSIIHNVTHKYFSFAVALVPKSMLDTGLGCHHYTSLVEFLCDKLF